MSEFRIQVQPSWSTKLWADLVGLETTKKDAISRACEHNTSTHEKTRVLNSKGEVVFEI